LAGVIALEQGADCAGSDAREGELEGVAIISRVTGEAA